MKYYSALKINELGSHEKTWRNITCTPLSQRSPSDKDTYCLTPTIRHSGKGKTADSKRISAASSGGGGKHEEAGHRGVLG